MNGPRILRPMGVAELCSEMLLLYRRSFLQLVGTSALFYVFYLLVGLLLKLLSSLTQAFGPFGLVIDALLSLAMSVGFLGGLAAVHGANIKVIADDYLGTRTTAAASWRYVLRCLSPYALTTLLVAALFDVMFVLPFAVLVNAIPYGPSPIDVIIPWFNVISLLVGMTVFSQFYFVWNVMVMEHRYYDEAISQSRHLAVGQRIRILAALFTVLLLGFAMLVIPSLVGVYLLWRPNVLIGTFLLLLFPVYSLLNTMLYVDVRVRKENLSIELLEQGMKEAPSAGGRPSVQDEDDGGLPRTGRARMTRMWWRWLLAILVALMPFIGMPNWRHVTYFQGFVLASFLVAAYLIVRAPAKPS